jgi:hypothetical protein
VRLLRKVPLKSGELFHTNTCKAILTVKAIRAIRHRTAEPVCCRKQDEFPCLQDYTGRLSPLSLAASAAFFYASIRAACAFRSSLAFYEKFI